MNGIIRERIIGKGALKYSLTETNDNGIHRYGVTVTSTLFGETPETAAVDDISADMETAVRFFDMAVENLVLPCTLKDVAENYISDIFSVKS